MVINDMRVSTSEQGRFEANTFNPATFRPIANICPYSSEFNEQCLTPSRIVTVRLVGHTKTH